MKNINILTILALILFVMQVSVFAQDITKVDFTNETVGASSKTFSSFVGTWYINKDGDNLVYAVDGKKWAQGTMSQGIAEKAKALYGQRYAEFLD